MDFLKDFLMDFTSSGSSELGGDLQKNRLFFSAFWEFRAGRRPPEKLSFSMFFGVLYKDIGVSYKNF